MERQHARRFRTTGKKTYWSATLSLLNPVGGEYHPFYVSILIALQAFKKHSDCVM